MVLSLSWQADVTRQKSRSTMGRCTTVTTAPSLSPLIEPPEPFTSANPCAGKTDCATTLSSSPMLCSDSLSVKRLHQNTLRVRAEPRGFGAFNGHVKLQRKRQARQLLGHKLLLE